MEQAADRDFLTQETPLSRSDFLLNTFVTITLYDSDDSSILDDPMALCKEYEEYFQQDLRDQRALQRSTIGPPTLSRSPTTWQPLAKGLEYCENLTVPLTFTIEPLSSL